MATNKASLLPGKAKKPRKVSWRPWVLAPRGKLARPSGQRLTIEVFKETPGKYPVVHITAEAHGKIMALVKASALEVSWLSPTKVTPAGNVTIYDVLVPHQECTPGSTAKLNTKELDGEDRLLSDLMSEGRFDAIRDLICWGHSHVNFGTFASGVDEDQTQDYLRRMSGMGKTRFVRLIANKGDDLSASLYLLDQGIAVHHAPIVAEPANAEDWADWARNEVHEKVIERVVKMPPVMDEEQYSEHLARVFFLNPKAAFEQLMKQRRPKGGAPTSER